MQENYNATIHFLTGNDQLDLELLNIELQTSYVDLLATVLGIISAVKAKQIIIQRMMQQQQSPSQQEQQKQQNQQKSDVQHPTPSEIAAFASCLGVYVILSYTRVSFIRLNELYNNIQSGKSNFSITPNINITTGFVYSCIGTLLRTVGAIQRVEEEAQITIL
ncbi:hypothetical protein [Clostridium beijerinckii]|jgi:hypothetical protein|uniref:Uncharacterized protein n=2 Tax=Clostridium beijerinckii TaxID=1520 RepID=A0AAE2RT64_CLOBE|nr:hypothetical protein [Clostridium beijerinckii]ABR35446.1 hypothetical protein Cbei_3319 [Clostridium beijerinckii NCIMB 8052]AIU05080.1 hypothetical protein Cbs_3319 [Clostridium beijerinckii ATCC 35702]MBF7809911.1 hypothetical protein [Clostridium beijerinckii]NRT69295.1 heme exporter protein D [Clostridium beijerinckii]NRT84557.1 heme exporter protein D [Clostridium beijerinckii]